MTDKKLPDATPDRTPCTGRDPARDKARDKARQRKIVANSSDKAARKNAPRIKALANRMLRRKDRARLLGAAEDAVPAPAGLKSRVRHWGTDNAAARREERTAERAFLDRTTVGEGTHGRRRAQGHASRRHDD
ncbi:MAG: hypothetical protein ACK4GT_02645 [Pararhodobacter sp.]